MVDRRTGRESAPDLTFASKEISGSCTWQTVRELSSDHKVMMIDVEGEREGRKAEKRLSWSWKRANLDMYGEKMEELASEMKSEGLQKMERSECVCACSIILWAWYT